MAILITSTILFPAALWRRHRKIITPTFHFKILDQFFDVFNSSGKVFIDILKRESIRGPVDIYPLLKLYALDVICGKYQI